MRCEWRTVKVGELGRIITGKTPKTAVAENYGGHIPFLTPSDSMEVKVSTNTAKTLTERGLSEVKNCLLPPHSICVSCIGSDLGKVTMTSEPTVTNQQINSIVLNSDYDADFIYYAMCILVCNEYLYLFLSSEPIIESLQQLAEQSVSTYPSIKPSDIGACEIFVPTFDEGFRLSEWLKPLFQAMAANREESAHLAALRDTLLPRLMSGELSVADLGGGK